MDIDTKRAASGFWDPGRVDMGMEKFLIVVFVFFLQEQSMVDVLCI